jgi:probable HAF family extracellular repeat protein
VKRLHPIAVFVAHTAVALSMLALPLTLTAQTYTVTDLGHLGGNVSIGRGINKDGQVVGHSYTGAVDKYGNGVYHGFRWDNTNGMVDVGTLNSDLNSSVSAISDSGVLAGASSTAPVQKIDKKTGWIYYVQTDHAVTWSSGLTVKKLASGFAVSINSSGEVVGSDGNNAILWSGSSTTNLGTLGGSGYQSVAFGINASGQIVGYAPTNDSFQTQRAFLWTPTTLNGTRGTMQNLDPQGFPGYGSVGMAINASGQVVGSSGGASPLAFLYTGGTMYGLGTLTTVGGTSNARGINSSGQVVGYTPGSSPNVDHAWAWFPSQPNGTTGQLTDLNSLIPAGSGWVLNEATGINDPGQIVGTGTINGVSHAFLLTPR